MGELSQPALWERARRTYSLRLLGRSTCLQSVNMGVVRGGECLKVAAPTQWLVRFGWRLAFVSMLAFLNEFETLIGIGIGAVGTAAAIFVIARDTRTARLAASFDHLRIIDERLHSNWSLDSTTVGSEILEYCSGTSNALGDGPIAYLALLNSMDLLALARKTKSVDRSVVDGYLAEMLKGHTLTPGFIEKMQEAHSDPTLYEPLRAWVAELRGEE